ncbi:MAG: glycosyltransferase family 4 protein [Wenzhouxiangellaceae bacterium]
MIETLGTGGAERMLCTLASGQVRSGDDVTVAVLRPPLDLACELEASGVGVVVLPRHHKWSLLYGAGRIAALAAQSGAEVVHAHLYFAAIQVGLGRMLRWIPALSVVTFHNLAYRTGANRRGARLCLRQMLARLIYRFGIDQYIAVSHAVARHYSRRLGLSGIHVVHNAVDLGVFSGPDRVAPSDASTRCPNLLLPGRLVHEKGHADLLDAILLLRNRGRCLNVVLAGGGPLRAVLERRIDEAGLRDSVRITGSIAHAELVTEMARADIVVVPSRFEGFGLTALEALALARPVVASRAGGLPEVVEHERSGLLFEPGDASGLADAIERLLDNPALAEKLGRVGRDRVVLCFEAERAVERVRAIYRAGGSLR